MGLESTRFILIRVNLIPQWAMRIMHAADVFCREEIKFNPPLRVDNSVTSSTIVHNRDTLYHRRVHYALYENCCHDVFPARDWPSNAKRVSLRGGRR